MSTKLDWIAEKARKERKLRFTTLAHHLTPEFLERTWYRMNRRGTSGVDGETTRKFEEELTERCQGIVARLKARSYQAPPVRRVEIPKGDGKTRALGIPTVEDRLVQRAVARILERIYEADFLNCSYGFRPGRSTHQALAVLRRQITYGKVNWVFETDIRGYFDHVNHQWLMTMLEQRIGDPSILRLIGKWLRAGVMKEGVVIRTVEGVPQGGPISPLLANVYLHYVLDLWFERRYRRTCRGKAYLTRFADDFVACFEYEEDARRFGRELVQRMAKFSLELAEEKTRLLRFGPGAREEEGSQGRKPGTFDFVGFTHICGSDRKGGFAVIRKPRKKSVRKFLDRTKGWLTVCRHMEPQEQQVHLWRKLRGFYQYFALYHCLETLRWTREEVYRQWVHTLRRRSQRHRLTWERLTRSPWFKLPEPKLVHRTV